MPTRIEKALADETDQLVHQILNSGVDGIVGGWPCQDISDAGKCAGLSGERSGLWRYLLRTIRLVRPKIALLENVAALLHRGMGQVLGDLAAIGYDTQWHCLRADAVGLPHRRRRVFAYAYPMCERPQRLFPQAIQAQSGPTWWQAYRSVEDLPERSDLYASTICGIDDGVAKRLHAIGNGNPPELIRQLTLPLAEDEKLVETFGRRDR